MMMAVAFRRFRRGNAVSPQGSTPHSLFVLDKKRTGRGRSKRKNRFWTRSGAVALRADGGLRGRGSSETVLTKPAGLLPARAGLLIYATPAPRVRRGVRRGGKSHGPCFWLRCRSQSRRETSPAGGHAGPPLRKVRAPQRFCRGRPVCRPLPRKGRPSAATAQPFAASPRYRCRVPLAGKISAEGIRGFPGPKVSPRAGRFRPWLPRGRANLPPPAAGGPHVCGPTRRNIFSFDRVRPFVSA